jgi:hypothetical protein
MKVVKLPRKMRAYLTSVVKRRLGGWTIYRHDDQRVRWLLEHGLLEERHVDGVFAMSVRIEVTQAGLEFVDQRLVAKYLLGGGHR